MGQEVSARTTSNGHAIHYGISNMRAQTNNHDAHTNAKRHVCKSGSISQEPVLNANQPQFIATQSTEDLLTDLNIRFLELMNQRVWESPFYDCLDPNIQIDLHGHTFTGRQAFIDGYRLVAEMSPELHVEITNSSAVVDEPTQTGTVVLHITLKGYYDDLCADLAKERAATILSCWKRERGRWTTHAYYMIYGIQEFL